MPVNKILLVDDSPTHLNNLKNAVEDVGAQIITANSGAEAVDKCRAEHPDLVFMDIVMDDIDGYNACRELSKDDSTSHIPIIFVTTKNNRADRLWAEKQGARALITKPYTKEQIVEQVDRFR